ncbi:tetratricopeptide repeat protein [Pendulispora brunnea]|uniref:Tetratricopeptide repeat protein n=1 Tax=Pendulispora brunnea TaxID=2905690 RepID=A0ABZ2KMT1_9BACT
MFVKSRVVACISVAVLSVLSFSADALAQQPTTSPPANPPVREQKAGSDLAVAESLFREGKAAMREKRYEEACSKFGESMRLDPQMGTLLNLAACHEITGKTASAWGEFNEVMAQAARAGQSSRVDFAKQHAAAVEAKLSRVKFVSAPPSSAAATIKIDGKTIGAGTLGTSIPMDPGTHRIEVSASGKKSRDVTFEVPQGPSTTEIQVPALEDTSVASARTEEPAPKEPTRSPSSSKRTLGFVLGGVGIAGLAAGTVFGVIYLGKKDDYNKCNGFCGGSEQADQDQKSSAQTAGWISTAAFGVGIVGLAAGTILILTSKPPSVEKSATLRVVPSLSLQRGGVSLEGTF